MAHLIVVICPTEGCLVIPKGLYLRPSEISGAFGNVPIRDFSQEAKSKTAVRFWELLPFERFIKCHTKRFERTPDAAAQIGGAFRNLPIRDFSQEAKSQTAVHFWELLPLERLINCNEKRQLNEHRMPQRNRWRL